MRTTEYCQPTPDQVLQWPRQVYKMIKQDGDTVLVEYRGDLTEVIGTTHGRTKYVRTESIDTENDTLVKSQVVENES